jgi:predicted extracellular nuclease
MGVPTGDCENLFFSEYIEGSSSNKALEIYNPTSASIDLSNYSIQRFNNGNLTASATLNLVGTIDADGVFVLANPLSVAGIIDVADSLTSFIGHNGNDVYVFFNYVDTIDVFGVIGSSADFDIGTEIGGAKDHTLVRKVDIHNGETNWAVGNLEWDVYEVDNFTFLGAHTMDACIPTEIETLENNSISVYPNPVINTINFSDLENINSIEIVDALGNVITTVDVNSNNVSLNTASLKSGFYIARLKSGNEIKSVKFIKK